MLPESPVKSIICPLCGGTSHHLIESALYEDIRYVYRQVYDVEISAEPQGVIHFFLCLTCDLRFFAPQVCGDAAFYERLQQFPWYYLAEKSEYVTAAAFVNAGNSVLEIGCGEGRFAGFLPKGCAYQGLEFNDVAVRKATSRGLAVSKRSVEELVQLQVAQFDAVFSFQVLEHVPRPAEFVRAATALLKPGGILVISVPSEDSLLVDAVNNVFNMPPHHVTRWTDAALLNLGKMMDLSVRHLEHEGLSNLNLQGFAKAQLLRLAKTKLGIRTPLVSKFLAGRVARLLLYALSLPLMLSLRWSRQSVNGHSVTIVYKKAFPGS